MKLTKEQVLENLDDVKKFIQEAECDKEETKSGVKLEIKSWSGRVCFSSTKATIREAVIEAVESGADLSEADLSGADLSEADLSRANLSRADLSEADLSRAEMQNVKFYGKTSNPKLLEQNQVDDFLAALGFKINKG